MIVKNVGKSERALRVVIGLILVLGGYKITGVMQVLAYIFGGIIFLTGFGGWCGVYSLLGFSSRGKGIDAIPKSEIERVVRENRIARAISVSVKKAPSKKKVAKKAAAKKATPKKSSAAKAPTKKVVKKAPAKKKVAAKKPVTKKAATKKVVKKAPAKKAVVKKSTPKKSSGTKKAPVKKKAVAKKKTVSKSKSKK